VKGGIYLIILHKKQGAICKPNLFCLLSDSKANRINLLWGCNFAKAIEYTSICFHISAKAYILLHKRYGFCLNKKTSGSGNLKRPWWLFFIKAYLTAGDFS
jgi:hypothetical protein